MRPIFETEVLEACLLRVPEGRETVRVRACEIASVLKKSNPSHGRVSVQKTANAIRAIFPIYKNPRARTKRFKVRRSTAEQYVIDNGMLLRPIADAKQCRIGSAIDVFNQGLRAYLPASRRVPRAHARNRSALRWRQVLALVDDVDGDDLRLYIPQWNPQDKLYVSILALPTELRNSVKAGQWLLAKAQVQSEDRSGVLLRDFEMSPEPDPNDGLA